MPDPTHKTRASRVLPLGVPREYLSCTTDPETSSRIREAAEDCGLSRSSLIEAACQHYIAEVVPQLPTVTVGINPHKRGWLQVLGSHNRQRQARGLPPLMERDVRLAWMQGQPVQTEVALVKGFNVRVPPERRRAC